MNKFGIDMTSPTLQIYLIHDIIHLDKPVQKSNFCKRTPTIFISETI